MRFQGYQSSWDILAALAFSDGSTKYQIAQITGWKTPTVRQRLYGSKCDGLVVRRNGVGRSDPHLWKLTESGIKLLQERLGLIPQNVIKTLLAQSGSKTAHEPLSLAAHLRVGALAPPCEPLTTKKPLADQ